MELIQDPVAEIISVESNPHDEEYLTVEISCPHCRGTHRHGMSKENYRKKLAEHRVSHCSNLSNGGYYIQRV